MPAQHNQRGSPGGTDPNYDQNWKRIIYSVQNGIC